MALHHVIFLVACVVNTLQFVSVAASTQRRPAIIAQSTKERKDRSNSHHSQSKQNSPRGVESTRNGLKRYGSAETSGKTPPKPRHSNRSTVNVKDFKCSAHVEEGDCMVTFILGRAFIDAEQDQALLVENIGVQVDMVSRGVTLSVQEKSSKVQSVLRCDIPVPITCDLKNPKPELLCDFQGKSFICTMTVGEKNGTKRDQKKSQMIPLVLGGEVRCELKQFDGICETTFTDHFVSDLVQSYRLVDVKKKLILLFLRRANALHVYTCNPQSYKNFELGCELETWNEIDIQSYSAIAKQKPAPCTVLRDGEECKVNFDFLSLDVEPKSTRAVFDSIDHAIAFYVTPTGGDQSIQFMCKNIPEQCFLQPPEPSAAVGLDIFESKVSKTSVRYSMIVGKWFILKDCRLSVNPLTGECTAHFQFDGPLNAKAVRLSVDDVELLIKLFEKTAGSEASEVLICKNYIALAGSCAFESQPEAEVTAELTAEGVSYSTIFGMAAPGADKNFDTTSVECNLLQDCVAEMKIYQKDQAKGAWLTAWNAKTVRGHVWGRDVAVFPSPNFSFNCPVRLFGKGFHATVRRHCLFGRTAHADVQIFKEESEIRCLINVDTKIIV